MDSDFNENHSGTNNNSSLLNVNTENGHLTVISPLTHSTPVIDQGMTAINNIEHETSTGSYTKENGLSNSSEEYFSMDAGVAMTEGNNLLNTSNNNLIDEAISCSAVKIDNFKTLNGNSLPEIETNVEVANDSFSKTVNSSLESAVKNIKCSPLKMDTADNSTELTNAVNQNFINSIAEASNNSENILCPITMDIVDFSFKDAENVSNNISGNLTDDVSKMPDSFSNCSFRDAVNPIADLNLVENLAFSEDVTAIHLTSEELESYASVSGEVVETKSDFKILENVKTTENPVDVLIPPKNLPNDIHVDSCKVDSINKIIEIPTDNPVGNFSNADSDLKVPENLMPVTNCSNVNSVLQELEKSDKSIEDYSYVQLASEVPENPDSKLTGYSSTSNAQAVVPENLISETAGDFSINTVSQVLESQLNITGSFSIADTSQMPENPISVPTEDFSNPGVEFKVPENQISISTEDFSNPGVELKVHKNPICIPAEDFSNPGVELKVPENPVNKQLEFSDGDCSSFKKLENEINSPVSSVDSVNKQLVANAVEQLPNEDFTFKISENQCNNPMDQLLDVDFGFKIPENPVTNECDEEFTDAVQFFKDPNSFHFLENIKTSVQPESSIPRSSLYVKFDPLLSKISPNVATPDNCTLISTAVKEISEKSSPVVEALNKHFVDIGVRESTGNVLISFDSPKRSIDKDVKTPVILPPPKLYTEDEFQQKLKIYELTTQEVYLKKQREMESQIINRDNLLKTQKFTIEELLSVLTENSDEFKKTRAKIDLFEIENKKLKEDLKTSTEDLQSVENTFADFHKRYEQCKGMLKTYKENEEHFKQVTSDLQNKIKEHEQMYSMLQERSEEMLEKANSEVASVKRAGEAQVTVLKAQLKKAEMKISSLESDIKQIKIENSQLGGICDDLMAKVSRP